MSSSDEAVGEGPSLGTFAAVIKMAPVRLVAGG